MKHCRWCWWELFPGTGKEVGLWQGKRPDGKMRYICPASPDSLHHPHGE